MSLWNTLSVCRRKTTAPNENSPILGKKYPGRKIRCASMKPRPIPWIHLPIRCVDRHLPAYRILRRPANECFGLLQAPDRPGPRLSDGQRFHPASSLIHRHAAWFSNPPDSRSSIEPRAAGREVGGSDAYGDGETPLVVSAPHPRALRTRLTAHGMSRSRSRSQKKKRSAHNTGQPLDRLGAPGTTRTCDPRIRNPVLYPPELRGLSGAP